MRWHTLGRCLEGPCRPFPQGGSLRERSPPNRIGNRESLVRLRGGSGRGCVPRHGDIAAEICCMDVCLYGKWLVVRSVHMRVPLLATVV